MSEISVRAVILNTAKISNTSEIPKTAVILNTAEIPNTAKKRHLQQSSQLDPIMAEIPNRRQWLIKHSSITEEKHKYGIAEEEEEEEGIAKEMY